jgi:hypothetical protein
LLMKHEFGIGPVHQLHPIHLSQRNWAERLQYVGQCVQWF